MKDLSLDTRGFHHVGIVVPSEEAALALMTLLGLHELSRGFVGAYHALCIFAASADKVPMEFVVATEGPLTKFNRGLGGVHHVALRVTSLKETAAALAKQGISLLEEQPVRGAGNFFCNFVHPIHTGGVIFEFVEEFDAGEHEEAS